MIQTKYFFFSSLIAISEVGNCVTLNLLAYRCFLNFEKIHV